MFPDVYSASFFFEKTLLYRIADTDLTQLPPPLPGATTLVVCKTEENKLNDTETAFLGNILKAVGLQPPHVQIIPVAAQNNKLPAASLLRLYQPKNIITFGFQPADLMLNLNPQLYAPFDLSGTKILLADTLNNIENNKSKKLVLWQQLKLMFGV